MLIKPVVLIAAILLAQGAPMAKKHVKRASASGAHRMLLAATPIPGAPNFNIVYGPPPATAQLPQSVAANYYDPNTSTMYLQGHGDRFAQGHEAGHALDSQVLSDADRARFTRILGLTGDWHRSDYGHSPAEWFADYYSAAASGMDLSREGVDSYARFTPRKLKRFDRALRRLALRHPELKPYQYRP